VLGEDFAQPSPASVYVLVHRHEVFIPTAIKFDLMAGFGLSIANQE
jgi:hypothetical protein